MKLVNCGITIDVEPAEVQRYINAGYVRVVEKPAERQAKPEPEQLPEPEVVSQPKASEAVEEKKAKARRKG